MYPFHSGLHRIDVKIYSLMLNSQLPEMLNQNQDIVNEMKHTMVHV